MCLCDSEYNAKRVALRYIRNRALPQGTLVRRKPSLQLYAGDWVRKETRVWGGKVISYRAT